MKSRQTVRLKADTTAGNQVKRRRPRTPAPMFRLFAIERLLLALYNSVPLEVRADVGKRLYEAWLHPSASDIATGRMGRLAQERFRIATLKVDLLDDIQSVEALATKGAR